MAPLIDIFWEHVDRKISSKPKGRKELQRELRRISKGRNKNTYTNWFKETERGPRPNIRLSDIEDVAAALDVPASDLIAPVAARVGSSALQLELPFGPGIRRISLEVDATDSALNLRIFRS